MFLSELPPTATVLGMTRRLDRGKSISALALGALALLAAVTALVVAGGCSAGGGKVVLEVRDGVEVSLRPEREPPREPPGPEFAGLTNVKVDRSLRRLVIRYIKMLIIIRSDPTPLLTEEQTAVMRDALVRELPKLPPDKRVGFYFLDQYKGHDVDVEIYPEGEFLVYEFRALMKRDKLKELGRGNTWVNEGIPYQQTNQVLLGNSAIRIIKDPIASAVRPNFRDARWRRGGRRDLLTGIHSPCGGGGGVRQPGLAE